MPEAYRNILHLLPLLLIASPFYPECPYCLLKANPNPPPSITFTPSVRLVSLPVQDQALLRSDTGKSRGSGWLRVAEVGMERSRSCVTRGHRIDVVYMNSALWNRKSASWKRASWWPWRKGVQVRKCVEGFVDEPDVEKNKGE